MKPTFKQTILWGSIIIVAPILINFVLGIYTPCNLYVVGDVENWIGFFGSYLGGVITAGVAYIILWHTIEYNKKMALRSFKKEELFREQKMLAEQISNMKFYSIGYISMFISQKDMYHSEILRLNAMFDKMIILYNSFKLLYENSTEISLVEYKLKYDECVELMRDDINEMSKLILRLQDEEWSLVISDIEKLTKKIGVHQDKNAAELFQAAQLYINEKQKELDKLFK